MCEKFYFKIQTHRGQRVCQTGPPLRSVQSGSAKIQILCCTSITPLAPQAHQTQATCLKVRWLCVRKAAGSRIAWAVCGGVRSECECEVNELPFTKMHTNAMKEPQLGWCTTVVLHISE